MVSRRLEGRKAEGLNGVHSLLFGACRLARQVKQFGGPNVLRQQWKVQETPYEM
jgi:hypothetical protein